VEQLTNDREEAQLAGEGDDRLAVALDERPGGGGRPFQWFSSSVCLSSAAGGSVGDVLNGGGGDSLSGRPRVAVGGSTRT
jgi:hypothetical protein